MANKIGRFEILSEIMRSEFSAVYKAADPDSGQTIALKTIQLQMLGDQASVLVDQILQEAEGTKPLNSHNIALLYGLEEIEGQFCAAMEYVQGNSIGTMLARKEGFSIWDLQDIARQTCQGLDHAHSHHVVHYSLEPAKIMVTWDGTVKVLSFGASSMGAFTCQARAKRLKFCTMFRRNSCAETRWTPVPTCSAWARFCTRWSPRPRLSLGTMRTKCGTPFMNSHRRLPCRSIPRFTRVE